MPLRRYLPTNKQLTLKPDEIARLNKAYRLPLRNLSLKDRNDP
jgi:hypothetical protein